GRHADHAAAPVGEPEHAVVVGQRLLDRLLHLVERRVELERQLLGRVDDPDPYFHLAQTTCWDHASKRSAMARNAVAASSSGWVTTMGAPASPPSRSAGTSGTCPSRGTPRRAASSAPPPRPNSS